MYLVPEKLSTNTEADKALSLPQYNSPLSSLQRDVVKLNSTNHNLDNSARWKEYERIFKSFFAFANADKGSLGSAPESSLTEPQNDFSVLFSDRSQNTSDRFLQIIHDSLPKSLKAKGILLLRYLAFSTDIQQGAFQFSPNGRLMKAGYEIPGSNILDLISHTLRTRKQVHPPLPGWEDFVELLRRANVPVEVLSQNLRRQFMKTTKQNEVEIQLKKTSPQRIKRDLYSSVESLVYGTPAEHPNVMESSSGEEDDDEIQILAQQLDKKWKPGDQPRGSYRAKLRDRQKVKQKGGKSQSLPDIWWTVLQ